MKCVTVYIFEKSDFILSDVDKRRMKREAKVTSPMEGDKVQCLIMHYFAYGGK